MDNTPINPREVAKFYAEVKLSGHFSPPTINILNFLSKNIVQYLNDHFILVRDLSVTLNEDFRHCFYDYSFVVVPVHKAFECYLNQIFTLIFDFKISKSPQASLGHHLNLSEPEKKIILKRIKSYSKINETDWLIRWNALADQWGKNRNPLTHSEEERIESLTHAEQVSNSILREINLSSKLFSSEFFDPIFKSIKETDEKNRAAKTIPEVVNADQVEG